MMLELNSNEYASFYQPYIDVLDKNLKGIVEHLEYSFQKALIVFEGISEEKHLYSYEEGKWTIKELIQHLIDTERVFAYRTLVFVRNDTTNLPGFDENQYVLHSNANLRPYQDLLVEFKSVRKSTILLFKSLIGSDFDKKGIASGNFMSVRALGYITSGHLLHHLKIIEERYLG